MIRKRGKRAKMFNQRGKKRIKKRRKRIKGEEKMIAKRSVMHLYATREDSGHI